MKQPGDTAKPGEVIEYIAEYKNQTKSAVKNVWRLFLYQRAWNTLRRRDAQPGHGQP